jgi:hypothetical protein
LGQGKHVTKSPYADIKTRAALIFGGESRLHHVGKYESHGAMADIVNTDGLLAVEESAHAVEVTLQRRALWSVFDNLDGESEDAPGRIC